MGREGRKNIGGYLVGRDVGSKELREQTLRSPVSQDYRSRLDQESALKVNNPA